MNITCVLLTKSFPTQQSSWDAWPESSQRQYTHGESSQMHNTTHVCSYLIISYSRMIIKCLLLTKSFPTQESSEPTWPETEAGIGHNMPRPQDYGQMQRQYYTGTSHEPRDNVAGIVEEFFRGDILSAPGSLIPPQSESEYILRTPSPEDGTQIEDVEQQYGRGLRQPHPARQRLSPSGPRQRQNRRRRRQE